MTLVFWTTFLTFGFVWMAASYTVMLIFANICLGGFYPANATPVEETSDMYRARVIFQRMALTMFFVVDATAVLMNTMVSIASWDALVLPAFLGVCFTFVYSMAKLADRVRPR